MLRTILVLATTLTLATARDTTQLRGGQNSHGCTPSDMTYDYLSLVVQWPGAWAHGAGKDIEDRFSLHGLWPSRSSPKEDSYPCNCANTPYDGSAIASIADEMQADWRSMKGVGQDASFWTHEWEKHGTCAVKGGAVKVSFLGV